MSPERNVHIGGSHQTSQPPPKERVSCREVRQSRVRHVFEAKTGKRMRMRKKTRLRGVVFFLTPVLEPVSLLRLYVHVCFSEAFTLYHSV